MAKFFGFLISTWVIVFPLLGFANPTSEELWTSTRLVHLTSYLKNGEVVPGDRSNTVGKNIQPPSAELLDENSAYFVTFDPERPKISFLDIQNRLTKSRFTSHWSVYEGVRDLSDRPRYLSRETRIHPSNWSKHLIAIVEPTAQFRGQVLGGYAQDMIVVGPHQLSSFAHIFAPKDQKEKIKRDNPNFKGTYHFYDNKKFMNARAAVDNFNLNFQRLYPQAWTFKQPNFLEYSDFQVLQAIRLILKNNQLPLEEIPYLAKSVVETPNAFSSDDSTLTQAAAQSNQLFQSNSAPSAFLRPMARYLAEYPCTNLVEFNGTLMRGETLFSSWIETDKMVWSGYRLTALGELENQTLRLFQTMDSFQREADLARHNYSLAHNPAYDLTPIETYKRLSNLPRYIENALKEVSVLSPATQTLFESYIQNLKSQLLKLVSWELKGRPSAL